MNEEVKEIKIQEERLSEGEPSVIKEFFLSNSGERELSALFGQSESELKKEFGNFKAQKIYRRLNSFIDSRDKLLGEVKTALKEALKYGFNSVTVFSNLLSIAKSVVKGAVKVRALINYPFGEEMQKAINYQVKCAVKEGADEVLIPLSVFAFRTLSSEELVKSLKKTVASARGKRVCALIDISVLTLPEVESAISILINSGVYSAVLCGEGGALAIPKSVVEDIVSVSGGVIKIECLTPVTKAEEVVSLMLSGASNVVSKNTQEVAKDLSQKIESLGVLENA